MFSGLFYHDTNFPLFQAIFIFIHIDPCTIPQLLLFTLRRSLPIQAKEFINLSSCIEVAPAPIIYPQKKPSNSPKLEPIAEEGAMEYDDDS
ncbi:hypothetical protein CFP56_029488 [Quercus suber]|uniref:Uncharacterized protein n=1 Tax=Quercus suber TaxID=58331 RepID=A0AAW0JTH2_QUESU